VLRAPILLVFAAVIAGTGLAELLPRSVAVWGSVLALAGAGLAFALWRASGVAVAALATLVATGGLSAALQAPPPAARLACASDLFRVRVARPAEKVANGPQGGQRTEVDLVAQQCGGSWVEQRGRVPLRLWAGAPVVRGDLLQLRLEVRPFAAPRHPGDTAGERARRRGWAGRGRALSHHTHVEHGDRLTSLLDRARAATAARLDRVLPRSHAAVARAVAVGDRGGITAEQRELWARAGAAHLLAISGLHVGLMASLAFILVRFLLGFVPGAAERFSVRRVAAWATVPLVVLFCAWVGAPTSAVRATAMAVAFLAGLALGRPSTAANALGIAGTAILLADPASLHDVGFLLSFAAVAGLLVIPRLPPARSRVRQLGRWLVGGAIASVAATVATAPVIAHTFGRISLVAPATNVVAVPLGGLLITPLAMVFALMAPVASGVERVLGAVLHGALAALDRVVSAAARVPFAALDVPQPRAMEITAYLALVVSAVLLLRRWRHVWVAALSISALLLAGLVVARGVERAGDGRLTAIHPYVGQGESTVLLLPEGGVVVFDAGGARPPSTWDPGRTILAPELRRRGIGTISLAVISHPHPDHYVGFRYLAENFHIEELWTNGMGHDLPGMAEIIETVRARGGRISTVSELPLRQVREGVLFEVVHPRPAGGTHYPRLDLNDNSMVLRLSYGERSLLLPADVGTAAEAIVAGTLAPTDVLKSPHHGSITSSSETLLGAVRPALAIISVGESNRYRLPDEEVLARYAAHGIEVLRTDLDGMVEMSTAGSTWAVSAFRGRTLTIPAASSPPPARRRH
jgi:competence protein ComEC